MTDKTYQPCPTNSDTNSRHIVCPHVLAEVFIYVRCQNDNFFIFLFFFQNYWGGFSPPSPPPPATRSLAFVRVIPKWLKIVRNLKITTLIGTIQNNLVDAGRFTSRRKLGKQRYLTLHLKFSKPYDRNTLKLGTNL